MSLCYNSRLDLGLERSPQGQKTANEGRIVDLRLNVEPSERVHDVSFKTSHSALAGNSVDRNSWNTRRVVVVVSEWVNVYPWDAIDPNDGRPPQASLTRGILFVSLQALEETVTTKRGNICNYLKLFLLLWYSGTRCWELRAYNTMSRPEYILHQFVYNCFYL